jgi:transposase
MQETISVLFKRDHATMPTLAQKPATTPIPVQLSAAEFHQFILPHLSMPKRGPKCKLSYHGVFHLILWVLYTGMPWQCFPVPTDSHGKPAIHYTTVYKVFATWADDGALEHAFSASVGYLADQKPLDLSGLHGDGTNTVAKKWGMALAIQATNTRRAKKSWPSSINVELNVRHEDSMCSPHAETSSCW